MEVVKGVQALNRSLSHPVVTIGNFDGVHLGHQQIIGEAVRQARARAGACVAYTFRPHPRAALTPSENLQLLTTYDEKLELLGQLGVDVVIEEPFSREFSTVDPDQFLNDILLHRMSTEAVVVGYDFSFGKERKGHISALEAFCARSRIQLTVVPPLRIEGEVVSSSRIRQHLLAGELPTSSRLLGRPFFYRGVVVRGEGRGRQLGFPTANLRPENKLALPYGVYATWAIASPSGKRHPSVTNIGVRPTFQVGDAVLPALVETHLLDTQVDLYGDTLEVQFVSKLRNEQRFSSKEQLIEQVHRDIETARTLLTGLSGGH